MIIAHAQANYGFNNSFQYLQIDQRLKIAKRTFFCIVIWCSRDCSIIQAPAHWKYTLKCGMMLVLNFMNAFRSLVCFVLATVFDTA